MQVSAPVRDSSLNALSFGVAALGAAIAASLFYSPLPFVLLLAIPACIYLATRPYELLLMMVFFIPFNFVFKIGPTAVAFEVVKVLAWIPFFLTRTERTGFIRSKYDKWIAVLGVLLILSLVRAQDLPFTLKDCVRFGSNLGLVYLCLNLVDSREKVLQILRVLTVSTFLVACYGFYQWAIQDFGALFWIVNPRLDTNLAHYRDYFWEWRHRIISVLTSEMELGHYFNLCIPIGVMLWWTEGRKQLGSKWLMFTICMFIGLILTFTFGAWLALVATSAIFVVMSGGIRRWKVVFGWAAVFAVIAAFLALGPLRATIEDKAVGNGIGSFAWDAATRLYGWKLALQLWWMHPLIGAGIGGYEQYSSNFDFVLGNQSQGSTPHQTYFYLLANTGLAGFVAILVIVLSTFRNNIRLMKQNPEMKWLAWALAFAICTNLLGWFSDDSGQTGPHASYVFWLFIGLSEVISRLGCRHVVPSEVALEAK